jgi:triosephosphate isomerase
MRKTIIAGNWKMNTTRKEALALTEALVKGVQGKSGLPEIVLCPPFTSLHTVAEAIKGSSIAIGAQNMEYRDNGAYTGEISPLMLLELGVKYVILGHSERRQYYGDTNQVVNHKVKAALQHGLVPILCVGETLDEREDNLTDSVVSRQVTASLADLKAEDLKTLVIAYEPVWAIGTGKVCESAEADRVIGVIRTTLDNQFGGIGEQTPVLYGGSVNAKNSGELLQQRNIDGGLVGGASLKPEEFLPIIEAGQKRLATAKV